MEYNNFSKDELIKRIKILENSSEERLTLLKIQDKTANEIIQETFKDLEIYKNANKTHYDLLVKIDELVNPLHKEGFYDYSLYNIIKNAL